MTKQNYGLIGQFSSKHIGRNCKDSNRAWPCPLPNRSAYPGQHNHNNPTGYLYKLQSPLPV